MRSKNYDDMKASFTALQPVQMVRVALVNGINPAVEHKPQERQNYLDLLKKFTTVPKATLDGLFGLLQGDNGSKEKEIEEIRKSLYYDTDVWKPFDYDKLISSGVVVPFNLDTTGLVRVASSLPRHKVIELSRPIEREGVDYLKHVHWRNKLVLNGRDVVAAFAREHEIELPKSYKDRGGPPPVSLYGQLAKKGFTFRTAMETCTSVIQSDAYSSRDISVLVIKHLNGDELRMHHHDYDESCELFLYSRKYGLNIIEKLGDRLKPEGAKYVLNVYDLPSRSRGGLTHRVEICYLPDFKDATNRTLEWMKTRFSCGCEWALNLRNFSFGRGETKHTAYTSDTHGGMVILQLQLDENGILIDNPQNMNPIPQPGFSRFIDVLRYQVMQGHGNSDYVKETGIEIAANRFWRLFGLDKMYWPKDKVGGKLLDSFY